MSSRTPEIRSGIEPRYPGEGNPSADLLYGIDNTYLGRALKEEIFDPYESRNLDVVPERFILDDTNHVTPIDYGYVNINYDKAFLEEAGISPPPHWRS